MEYLIVCVLAFLGVPLGALIGTWAREELEPGREHFGRLMHALYFIIIAAFLYYNWDILFLVAIGAMVILFTLSKNREDLYYIGLAPMLLIAHAYNGFGTIAPLAFLYGFPLGTMLTADDPKKGMKDLLKEALKKYGLFVAVALALEAMFIFAG